MRIINLLILLSVTMSIFSQVTIGADIAPGTGALLELKQSGNTTKGLGLPRVALRTLDDLFPCVEDMASKPESKDIHIGLVVYNITEQAPKPKDPCEPFPELDIRLQPGIMAWDGKEWVSLTGGVVNEGRDPNWIHPAVKFVEDSDGNSYTYRKFGAAGTWMTANYRGKKYSENTQGYDPNEKITCAPSNLLEGDNIRYFSYPSPPDEAGIYPAYNDREAYASMPNLGLRYNFVSALNKIAPTYEGEFIQGICPDGWHVPWGFEYEALITEISSNKNEYAQNDIADEVAPSRWALTPCLPYFPYNVQAGASLMAVDGGLALLWNGSHSLDIEKEYGDLSVYIALKWTSPYDYCGGNVNIRNKYEENEWRYYNAYPRYQYSLRCKKDVDD